LFIVPKWLRISPNEWLDSSDSACNRVSNVYLHRSNFESERTRERHVAGSQGKTDRPEIERHANSGVVIASTDG
jgi:hypothetical protein